MIIIAGGKVSDRETIVTLLNVIGSVNEDSADVYSFGDIMAELRTLLEDTQTLADDDVSDALPFSCFSKCEGGWKVV